jgi:hypothetical protein
LKHKVATATEKRLAQNPQTLTDPNPTQIPQNKTMLDYYYYNNNNTDTDL